MKHPNCELSIPDAYGNRISVLLLTLLLSLPNGLVRGQSTPEFICGGFTEQPVMPLSQVCAPTGTGIAWNARYKFQGNYVPGTPLNPTAGAVKTINVALHVYLNNAGTGNIWQEESNITMFNQIFSLLETGYYELIDQPSDPIPGYSYATDTKIRINLMGIEFHRNTTLRNLNCDSENAMGQLYEAATQDIVLPMGTNNLSIYKRALNIHMIKPNCCGNALGVASPLAPNSMDEFLAASNIITCGALQYLNDDRIEMYARHWAHEIGHHLGLMHPYWTTGGCENSEILRFDNPDFLEDMFGEPQLWCGLWLMVNCFVDGATLPNERCYFTAASGCDPWNNFESPPGSGTFYNDNCTNNVMGNNLDSRFTSTLQIGRMHRTLMTCNTSKYAWGYDPEPYVLEEDETWDFHMKFYQDIVVPEDVTLTITCELQMVPEARIVVQPRGKLLIDGGTIRAAVFSPERWIGIEVWGPGAQSN